MDFFFPRWEIFFSQVRGTAGQFRNQFWNCALEGQQRKRRGLPFTNLFHTPRLGKKKNLKTHTAVSVKVKRWNWAQHVQLNCSSGRCVSWEVALINSEHVTWSRILDRRPTGQLIPGRFYISLKKHSQARIKRVQISFQHWQIIHQTWYAGCMRDICLFSYESDEFQLFT